MVRWSSLSRPTYIQLVNIVRKDGTQYAYMYQSLDLSSLPGSIRIEASPGSAEIGLQGSRNRHALQWHADARLVQIEFDNH